MVRLYTPRLLIRDHLPGDLQCHHELMSNPKVMWYLPDIMTHTLEESQRNLRQAMGQIGNPERKYWFFLIEERATGKHVGEIGYTVIEPTPAGRLVEAGYFIRPVFWGRGYITEAFREVIRFAFEAGGVCRIACGCAKENAASERVMQKCGLIKEAELKEYQWHDGKLKDRVLYRLLRYEWQPNG